MDKQIQAEMQVSPIPVQHRLSFWHASCDGTGNPVRSLKSFFLSVLQGAKDGPAHDTEHPEHASEENRRDDVFARHTLHRA